MKYKHKMEYALLRSVIFFLNLLPVKLILLICSSIGYLAWIVFPFRLRVTYTNLSNVFPEKNHREKIRLLRKVYFEICKTFGLVFILHRKNFLSTIQKTKISGLDKVKKALAQNKGIILTTCHASWFEAYFAWFNMSDLPTTLIYQKQANPLSDKFFIRQRQSFGNNLEHLNSREGMPAYEEALHKGRMLIVSLDQSYSSRGTPVNFFGKDLPCAKGAAILHLRTGAPVFTSVYYMKNGQLHIDFDEVKLPEYDTIDEESINDILTRAIKPYEYFIRSYPEQWFSLFHRLWSKNREDYPPVKRNLKEIFF